MSAAQLFGAELAARLAASLARTLNLQLDDPLDALAWEAVSLGSNGSLGEHFALARQLLSDAESLAPPPAPLAEALAVAVVQGRHAAMSVQASCLAIDALDTASAREVVAQAHVLALDGVTPAQLLRRTSLPRRERLVVLRWPETSDAIAALLDRGAAALGVAAPWRALDDPLQGLLTQLGSGATVGEAVRRLHQHAAPGRVAVRLYGAGPATPSRLAAASRSKGCRARNGSTTSESIR